MSTKRTNRTKKAPKRNRNRPNVRYAKAESRSTTFTKTRIAPDELDIKLLYRSFGQISNIAAPLVTKKFHSNGAYDVDPSLGSTETYGFDEYAALYSYYRVIGYSYVITIVNDLDVDCMAYVLNTNTDPTLAGSRFDLYSTNPHCKSMLISQKSPNMHTFRGHHRISQITGTPNAETADSFRALTTGLPSDLTWITLGAEFVDGTEAIVSYDFRLFMDIRFYGREVDLSLAGFAARANAHLVARAQRNLEKQQKKLTSQPPSITPKAH